MPGLDAKTEPRRAVRGSGRKDEAGFSHDVPEFGMRIRARERGVRNIQAQEITQMSPSPAQIKHKQAIMNEIKLDRIDLNLMVTVDVLMSERSVTRVAGKLHKTPSVISHALNSLRKQLGDPLMVRMGDRVEPRPFALRLIEDVRPILRESSGSLPRAHSLTHLAAHRLSVLPCRVSRAPSAPSSCALRPRRQISRSTGGR